MAVRRSRRLPSALRLSIWSACILLVSAAGGVVMAMPGHANVGNGPAPTHAMVQQSKAPAVIQPKSIPPKATASSAGAANGSVAGSTEVIAQHGDPNWLAKVLYADPNNEASTYAAANPNVTGASILAREGQVPVAQWFGDWNSNVTADVDAYVSAATAKNQLPVVVLYNIPKRDCGDYSSGGAVSLTAYGQWIAAVSNGLKNRQSIVILEPDALAKVDCLTAPEQLGRYQVLKQAIVSLKTNAQATVYLDAGNARWQPLDTMQARLASAGIAQADGFSLNIANFVPTAESQRYGDSLSALTGGSHYVIDTSRNGHDADYGSNVCNPAVAALGQLPTTQTGHNLNDAQLWIKIPWESDGSCNGNPAAGQVFWSYAIQLAQHAGW